MSIYVSHVQRTTEGKATRVELNADGVKFAFEKSPTGKVVSLGRQKGAHVHTGLYVPKVVYADVIRKAYGVLCQVPKKPTQLGFKFNKEVK